MNMDKINRADKKSKWTVMKYVNDFNLLVQYADLIRNLKAKVDENSIIEVNSIMRCHAHCVAPPFLI